MKKFLSVFLSITMLATLFAMVPVSASTATYETLVNENYQDSTSALYTDAEWAKNVDGYGIGHAIRLTGTANGRKEINNTEFTSTAVYSDGDIQRLGANCFVETEFDLLSENAVSTGGGFEILLTGKNGAADFTKNRGLLHLYFNKKDNTYTTGGINAEVMNKDSSGNFSTPTPFPQLSSTFEDGKWYRIKIVKQITDENTQRAQKIVSISVNGETVMSDKYFKTPWNSIKSYDTIRFYIDSGNTPLKLLMDNLTVKRYYTTAENAPLDYSRLIAQIRKAEDIISNKKYYDCTPAGITELTTLKTSAVTACESTEATQTTINTAATALAEKTALYTKNAYETLLSENFEGTPAYFTGGTSVTASEFGMGSHAVKLTTSPSGSWESGAFAGEDDAELVPLFNGTDSWKNGSNAYVQTGFDVKVKNVKDGTGAVYIPLSSDIAFTSYKGESVGMTTLKFDGASGKIVALGPNGTETNLQSYDDDTWYRITVVNQITDGSATNAMKQSAIYINGESVLASEMNFVSTNQSKIPYFNDILTYIQGTTIGEVYYDNLRVVRYNGTDKAPVMKDALLTLIRNAEKVDVTGTALTEAKETYEDHAATQNEVDTAYNALMTEYTSKTNVSGSLTWDKVSTQAQDAITENLTFPTSFVANSATYYLNWTSSKPIFISNDGEVVRPKNDQEVTLTAEILTAKNAKIGEKEFTVTVKADTTNIYDYKILDVELVDAEGKASDVPVKGGGVGAVTLLSRENTTVGSVVAVMYNNNIVSGIDIASIPATAEDATVTVDLSLNFGQSLTDCTVKVYAWNMSTLVPLADMYEYRVQDHVISSSTIYIIGDSTAHDYEKNIENSTFPAAQTGWGQMMQDYFDSDIITVNDMALCGRSSKSYYNSTYYTQVKNSLQSGDYLFIQFGHNDSKEEEALATVPETTYKDYMRAFVRDAKDKGAIPVIVTSIPRLIYSQNGKLKENEKNMDRYVAAAKAVAEEQKIVCIDLFREAVDYINEVGRTTAEGLYLDPTGSTIGYTDITHLNETGATLFSGYVKDGIKAQIPLLANCLLDDTANE